MAIKHSDILIVGAGVAGLTLAALLSQRGEKPFLIEKQPQQLFEEAGYMLGLLPLGGRVLNALGKQRDYLNHSNSMTEYTIYDGGGYKLNTYPLAPIRDRFGPYRGISRNALISMLQSAAGSAIHFDMTIKNIQQNEKDVTVTFSDNSVSTFSLVVVADGLHSTTRRHILDEKECTYRSTGWGGWVTWINSAQEFQHSYNEYWGAGSFLGLYPVKNQIGAFLGGPTEKLEEQGRPAFVEKVQKDLKNAPELVRQALQSFKELDNPYFWDFHDCRAERWSEGRVVLLGDAATGFLPTAGIGASMAMDSAAALADELSRTDAEHLEYALQLFENRQRKKVEKAQKKSRNLGRWMFVNTRAIAWLRNKMLHFYSLDMMLQGFDKIMLGRV